MNSIAIGSENESHQEMDQRLTQLVSTLIGLEGDAAATAMAAALQLVGEALHVDRVVLLEFGRDGHPIPPAFQWAQAALPRQDIDVDGLAFKTLIDDMPVGRDAVVLDQVPGDLPTAMLMNGVSEQLERMDIKSLVVVPVTIGDESAPLTCAVAVGAVTEYRAWAPDVVRHLELAAQIMALALHSRRQGRLLSESRAEIVRLTAGGDTALEPRLKRRASIAGFDNLVGDSPALKGALEQLQQVAATDSTVLLLGETGTGKELFAKALHERSSRRDFSIVSVNCAALPPTLIESELFGHERGAFTGAVTLRQGRFEMAHRGTLFLDEIGDLPLDLQAKLLRVLQEGEFERLGASHTRKVDVRIVAATHRALNQAVADGEFREDLYYRLNVFPIVLPPLRDRREDIPALTWFLIRKRQQAMHRWIKRVPEPVFDLLMRHSWPGNIRELENVVERALIHSTGETLILLEDDIEAVSDVSVADTSELSAVERVHIEKVLRECGWHINGKGNAAERLGLHPNTLRFRMKKLGIVRRVVAAVTRRPLVPSP